MQHSVIVRRGKSRANLPRDLDRFIAGQTSDPPQQ
jgi:hypothetical protein